MSFISLQPTCFVAIKCSGEVRRQGHHARPGDSEEQDRARKDPERLDPQQRESQSRVHHSVPLQVVQLLSTTKFPSWSQFHQQICTISQGASIK